MLIWAFTARMCLKTCLSLSFGYVFGFSQYSYEHFTIFLLLSFSCIYLYSYDRQLRPPPPPPFKCLFIPSQSTSLDYEDSKQAVRTADLFLTYYQ